MPRRSDRITVSHVGSLVRPPRLIPFLEAMQNGASFDRAAFAAALRESVIEVARLQAEAGIDIVSDGEYGKAINWAYYIHGRLTGITKRPMTEAEAKDPLAMPLGGRDREAFPEFYGEYDARVLRNAGAAVRPVITGAITYCGQEELNRDIGNLKAGLEKLPGVQGFLPVVAPASALPNAKNEHYKDEESYLFALADALKTEYRAVIDAGLDVQVDDAFFPYMFERLVPPMTLAQYRHWAELRIAALNRALEGLPVERTRYHICWGSWNGPHIFDVPLKDIVDIVTKVKVGAFSFEAANPRHEHEWKVWRNVKLAPGQALMPGVISHATNIVEHPELVAERLTRFAEIVGKENVIAGTDCGFSQSPLAGRVHRTIMWAKLKALSDGAALATRQLWGR
ncbi:MAG TPA: cobalamin-independent methionine synthase II family protein [Stellaceae bacterium]|jgi:5-methyltetrahydropteroyltriglutamate--homocysteine methyltransferase|nr:cobalamin-independent methionine synthase II family protein [Stellaceae bacterium]